MSWNYRIIKRIFTMPGGRLETQYAIYEVYYGEGGDIKAWSEVPMYVAGETLDELKDDFSRFQKAFEKPVLDWEELEKMTEK